MKTSLYLLFALLALPDAGAQQSNEHKKADVQERVNIEAQATATVKRPTVDYLQSAAKSSIFVYDGSTRPCDPPPAGTELLPVGSGFVVGIGQKGHSPDQWRGWKFLITAAHVIGNRTDIIVRLNRTDTSSFKCAPLHLLRAGEGQNVFFDDINDSDVVAVSLPDIGNTDPTVFDYSMLLDAPHMSEWEIKTGTNIFSVGYLYGYSGQTQNYPVTKFGKISVLTTEKWYLNPELHRPEQAYIVEMQNAPGLSGAPVMTYGVDIKFNPLRYRELEPYVVGVVKGLLLVPVSDGPTPQLISQGLAAVEPADHIRELLRSIADRLKRGGAEVEIN